MKRLLYFVLIISLATGCENNVYRKTPGGMPYKIFKSGDSTRVTYGDIVKVNFTRKIKDSVHYSTYNTLPAYIPVSERTIPYDLSEIWTKLKKGDSVVTIQLIDTFIRRNPMHPDFLSGKYKKGDKITINLKILDVFPGDSAAMADEAKEKEKWLTKEKQVVSNYIKENNINATQTANGVYVQILEQGSGPKIDSGKYVTLNYTGSTFDGKVFDSNTDSTFRHFGPLSFTTAMREMIPGFDEGVQMLNKGAHAKIYVPSTLGYGANPNPASGLKPYENLVFEVKILDVQDKAPAPPKNNNSR